MNDIIKKIIKNKYIVFIVIIVVGLFLIFIPNTKKEETAESDVEIDMKYVNELESRIEQIVSSIDGVGDSEVMVNFNSTSESVYVKESKKSSDSSESSDKRQSEEAVITMTDREGNQYALITKKLMPEITGVVIACDGGDNKSVQSSVINAVCTLLGIGANNVCVIAKS